ncbi:coagulation factor IX-like [Sesbania bispinosa]|nr:coagulation factor IX-like [Sesbania bispinosa]
MSAFPRRNQELMAGNPVVGVVNQPTVTGNQSVVSGDPLMVSSNPPITCYNPAAGSSTD